MNVPGDDDINHAVGCGVLGFGVFILGCLALATEVGDPNSALGDAAILGGVLIMLLICLGSLAKSV